MFDRKDFKSIKHVEKVILFSTSLNQMVIVVGNGHGDTSSNPGRDWLHFT